MIPDHPRDPATGAPISANSPELLDRMCFGHVFNSRHDAGRLKMELWLDTERAAEVGGDAQDVVAKAERRELFEVSIGALVSAHAERGVDPVGQEYQGVWDSIVPDHLAAGLRGSKGACSTEMGCGGPRAAQSFGEGATVVLHGREPVLTAAVMSSARRPTYAGTESAPWSRPSFSDYLAAYYDGDNPPASLATAPGSLKRAIASRSLLGDPRGTTLSEVSLFPVVRPSNDRLNERALRAVLGGRGSQANIPKAALDSAQEMARRLLNQEFDAQLEAATAANEPRSTVMQKIAGLDLLNRIRALVGLGPRAAQDGMSDTDLRAKLFSALHAIEPGFLDVAEVYPSDSQVIYVTNQPDEEIHFWMRDFMVEGDDVTVAEDRMEVEPQMTYEPVAASGEPAEPENDPKPEAAKLKAAAQPCGCTSAACTCTPESGGDAASTNQKETTMSETLKALVERLISHENPFTQDDAEALEAFGEEKVRALLAKCEEPEAEPAQAEPEPKAAAEGSEPEPDPKPEGVTLSPEEYQKMKSAADAHQRAEDERKAKLIAGITAKSSEYTEADLEDETVEGLAKLHCALVGAEPTPDYSGQGFEVPATGPQSSPAPKPWNIALGKDVVTGKPLDPESPN